jgi:hypothetical protein
MNAANHNHRSGVTLLSEKIQQVLPSASRQHEVENDHIKIVLLQHENGVLDITRCDNLVATTAKEAPQALKKPGFVIHD